MTDQIPVRYSRSPSVNAYPYVRFRCTADQALAALKDAADRSIHETDVLAEIGFHNISIDKIADRLATAASPPGYTAEHRRLDEVELDRRERAVTSLLRRLHLYPLAAFRNTLPN